MPLDPHNWNGDFLTATLLDNDLYTWNGATFTANGIRFHARRPLYKSYNAYASNNNSIGAGNWGLAFANTSNANPQADVIVDTPGLLGAWFDPTQTGNIRLNKLVAGGGLNAIPGGLMLATSYCLWPVSSSAGAFGAGIGNAANPASTPFSIGTIQAPNSAHQTCSMCIDLLDSNVNAWAPMGFNDTAAAAAPIGTVQGDGSGWASRFLAHWAAVYTSNGWRVTFLPAPQASWTSSSALTSNLLNSNTGLRGPLRFLNMPPLLRAEGSTNQSLTANTVTTLNIAADSGMDNYTGFASNTYTVPFNGLYFVHGYAGIGNIAGNFKVGVNINGTNYWGPRHPQTGGAVTMTGTKTQIFSLNAGDTITLQAFATAAATVTITPAARLVVLYVGEQGAPAALPTIPDTTYRWTAGTPGPVHTLFNAHIANDLLFLHQRPYLLSYQATAQTGISPSTATSVTMDTVKGIVHADSADNYAGWNSGSNAYVATRQGWYLAVEEVFLAQPTLTSTPSVLAILGLSPHGADTWDRYQQQNMITSTDGSGATAVSYYYLRVGDSIQPGLQTYDSTSTTIATTVATGTNTVNSHFELVYLGE